ncbi:hypothetical protein XENORESO_012170 [Xenotaenia resolanae]|uniref:Secreted protein n=1 Tax=Xenotaenia resolanae TaxID=208358 RepID=A0ABV0X7P9_9TELE
MLCCLSVPFILLSSVFLLMLLACLLVVSFEETIIQFLFHPGFQSPATLLRKFIGKLTSGSPTLISSVLTHHHHHSPIFPPFNIPPSSPFFSGKKDKNHNQP